MNQILIQWYALQKMVVIGKMRWKVINPSIYKLDEVESKAHRVRRESKQKKKRTKVRKKSYRSASSGKGFGFYESMEVENNVRKENKGSIQGEDKVPSLQEKADCEENKKGNHPS